MKTNATQRSLAHLRRGGYTVGIVEHWNAFDKIRQDFLGFADLILAKSAAWIKGWKKAHTTLQRSWFRRFFVALFIWCVLVGSGIGFLWESANIFMHLTSGESLKVKTVTKWQGYFRIHPRYPKEEGR